ncbi:PPE family protein PPE32 [Mycobacterium tuberculosis H37Rv] [Mycobacterium shimoidei]|uniref:PPE family protein PPE32 [Mycobacterium tuberculosis H37Rv] n=1 Tax=Mycobacterium shimoidei TaxID=29313 RepID=A0A375Z0D2_MYCSH|nr:PPE family protein [Mycobacterium shimoidei]SRX94589.1 PPE family protein PPE32 [Mycobacterium tuberculosis H37Rv] [Mycobacterium shimoidei]
MFDFGALPPEINSARMYAGPGSGPMMAAASAWDALAGQLELFAAGYSEVVSGLHGESWLGPASIAMAAAAAPYVTWAATAAVQAQQTANQARAAAGAYEAAFAATVPPAVVAENRIQLAMLVATNFFGQNTPAIAATEAAYAEMWAQDAAAMYGYAASASTAATLTPFSEPPQTTTPAAESGQAAAMAQAAGSSTTGQVQGSLSGLMSAVPHQLQSLATAGSSAGSGAPGSPGASSPIVSAFSAINALTGPLNPVWQTSFSVAQWGNFGTGLRLAELQAAKAAAKAAPTAVPAEAVTGGGRAAVFASAHNAEQVGRLSVPQTWTAAAPSAGPAAEPVSSAGSGFRVLPAWAAHPPANAPSAVPAIGPITNGAGSRGGNAVFRMRDRRFRMPRPAVGG